MKRSSDQPTTTKQGPEMNLTRTIVTTAIALLPAVALAQSAAVQIQRDINQQQRIQQGLQSGELTTQEAARLEREEAAVSRMQARALSDGKLTEAERARIDHAQDRVSRHIYAEKHDAQKGDPDSPSSQRMQAAVQRNINQNVRIREGIESGELTQREVAKLQRGQARIEQREARAGSDGHIGPREHHRLQRAENRQSARIYREKHDRQARR